MIRFSGSGRMECSFKARDVWNVVKAIDMRTITIVSQSPERICTYVLHPVFVLITEIRDGRRCRIVQSKLLYQRTLCPLEMLSEILMEKV